MTMILKNHFEAPFMTNNSLLLMFHNICNQSFNGDLNDFQLLPFQKKVSEYPSIVHSSISPVI